LGVKGEFPACPTSPGDGSWAMFIVWTSLDDQEIAEQLAFDAVAEKLAVCAQVDLAPIVSVYWWEGETKTAREYRIAFKCLPHQLDGL
jgi:uncharacterized protein involved in tolerance to divalent cations